MSMTILQLKQELTNHGVSLPEASARKEVYEKLYQDFVVKPKLKSQRKSTGARKDDFSDDDVVGNSGNGVEADEDEVEYFDEAIAAEVEVLSNEQIYVALTELGQNIGPVVATTREMYKKKLIKLWSQNGHFINESGVANGSGENGLHLNGHNDEGTEVENEIPQQFSSDDEEIETEKVASETLPTEKQSGGLTKEQKKKFDALMSPGYYSPNADKSQAPSTSSDGSGLKGKTKKSSVKTAGGDGTGFSLWSLIFGFLALLLAVYIAYEYFTEPDTTIDIQQAQKESFEPPSLR